MGSQHFKITETLDGKRIASVLVDPEFVYPAVPDLMYEACLRVGANDCDLDAADVAAIRDSTYLAEAWTPDKRRQIWEKALSLDEPSKAIALFHETGLLDKLLPELSACAGVEQNQHHKYDVFWHLLKVCDYLPKDDIRLRWSGLLHDIAKPDVRTVNEATEDTLSTHTKLSQRPRLNISYMNWDTMRSLLIL